MTDRRPYAFSLVELIVVMAILCIVSLVAIQYLVSASQLYVTVLAQRRADTEVLGALNRLERELRTWQTTLTADVNTVTFVNQAGRTNTLARQGRDVVLNGNMLAGNAETFTFTYYDTTNGLLVPLPLGPTNRARIRRLALACQIALEGQAARADVNYFYPGPGILK